ncbi:MAG: hypothetical protein P1R58_12845, partial [bacterium]|nr:hypothetical protein [bacterium]
ELMMTDRLLLTPIIGTNQPPVLVAPATASGDAGTEIVVVVSGADPDGNIPVLSAIDLPTGASFEDSLNGSGYFIWTTGVPDIGDYSVIFIASDGDLEGRDTTVVSVTDPVSCCDLAGDFDNSGEVDITDLTSMVDFMFNGGASAVCGDEADVDGSCSIDITDLTYRVNYMFAGGPAPICGCAR